MPNYAVSNEDSMKTIKLYDKELKFIKKHAKAAIRRPEWNPKRNLYGVAGDLIQIANMYEQNKTPALIKSKKYDRSRTCIVMLIEVLA